MHNPLSQFEIKPIIDLSVAGFDISFSNSALFMMLSLIMGAGFLFFSTRSIRIVPDRKQMAGEMIHGFIEDTIIGTMGESGKKFMPLIFTIFMFVSMCNLFGMLPYSFTVTSHIAVTFALAMCIFLLITIYGFAKHGLHFLSIFLPEGTPMVLAPLMIVIEMFSFLARPVSLSLRLTANMIAGHVLLKVLAGFIVMMSIFIKWLPIPLIVVLIGFEIFVSLLQAYIFTILTCVYLNDAVNLH